MKRKFKLSKELSDLKAKEQRQQARARQKPIAAEVEPDTYVKEEISESPFAVSYSGTKTSDRKSRGANIITQKTGTIKVDAKDEDSAKKLVSKILDKRMNLRRYDIDRVRAEDFKTFREGLQPGFAVRYLDPKNGKRFAVAYKIKKDADDKAAQLKKDGAKDISITKHTLNFKEGDDLEEGVEVQITLKGSGPINKRSHVHDFKSKADAEKWIKWYKTGGSSSALMPFEKNKVDKIEIHEIAEGFEWHTLSFLKRKGFNVARFSYGKLLVPKSDVEDVKKVLEKEYNKRDGDIFELPKKIVGESSFADLKHKSQPVEVREQFTTSQLTNLRKQWATVKTINPTGDKYKALVKWINDKEFKMVNQLARAKINFVSYIAKKALMDKWKFKKDTINKVYGGLLSNQYENLSLDKVFKEVSPPGWEGSVRAMKKHPELGGEDGKDGKNIYALAWYLKNKGAKSHYKDKGGKPVKKDKYKNEETEQHAQMISGVENEGRKETTNE
jgi:hypothetical protein